MTIEVVDGEPRMRMKSNERRAVETTLLALDQITKFCAYDQDLAKLAATTAIGLTSIRNLVVHDEQLKLPIDGGSQD